MNVEACADPGVHRIDCHDVCASVWEIDRALRNIQTLESLNNQFMIVVLLEYHLC